MINYFKNSNKIRSSNTKKANKQFSAAAPLPAAHSYGLQPQGAGNSSTTAMTQPVSPSFILPAHPPFCAISRQLHKKQKELTLGGRGARVRPRRAPCLAYCLEGFHFPL